MFCLPATELSQADLHLLDHSSSDYLWLSEKKNLLTKKDCLKKHERYSTFQLDDPSSRLRERPFEGVSMDVTITKSQFPYYPLQETENYPEWDRNNLRSTPRPEAMGSTVTAHTSSNVTCHRYLSVQERQLILTCYQALSGWSKLFPVSRLGCPKSWGVFLPEATRYKLQTIIFHL